MANKQAAGGWYRIQVPEGSPNPVPPPPQLGETPTPEQYQTLAKYQSSARCGLLLSKVGHEGDTAECPVCLETRTIMVAGTNPKYTMRYWSDCTCVTTGLAEDQARRSQVAEYGRRRAADQLAEALGLKRVEQFQMESFDRDRLITPDGDGSHPLDIAKAWVDSLEGLEQSNFRHGPPPALYFYSQGKGRGKTHLASAIAWEMYNRGFLTAFIEETSYLRSYWGAEWDQRDQYQKLLARVRLLVIDDLGQNKPTIKNGESGAAKAWYDIFNERWLGMGWNIITSNYTLEDLEQNGTISMATYSRIYQMTRGQMVLFDGTDYRLESY